MENPLSLIKTPTNKCYPLTEEIMSDKTLLKSLKRKRPNGLTNNEKAMDAELLKAPRRK